MFKVGGSKCVESHYTCGCGMISHDLLKVRFHVDKIAILPWAVGL